MRFFICLFLKFQAIRNDPCSCRTGKSGRWLRGNLPNPAPAGLANPADGSDLSIRAWQFRTEHGNLPDKVGFCYP